jgi:hypothetical protein
VDTVGFLDQAFRIPVRATILEKTIRIRYVKAKGWTIYFTSVDHPTLVRIGRLALALEPMEGIEGVVFNPLAALLARHIVRWLRRTDDANEANSISLMHPCVMRHIGIEVCEGDMFDPFQEWYGRFDAVRASNLLNLSYYSEGRIREAIGIMHRYLREEGALLVSRNLIGQQGEREIGGLWRKKGAGFTRVADLGELPEIAPLIESHRSLDTTLRHGKADSGQFP